MSFSAPKALKAAAAVLLGLVLLAAAAELSARSLFKGVIRAAAFSESDMYYYYDIDGVRRHIPGKTGYEKAWNETGKVSFSINSYGLRGADFPLKKPAGEFRLLMLGDSITLGRRLAAEDTFVERLGAELRAGGRNIRVMNAGVGDAGIREESELLDKTGFALAPDAVVLGLYLNDSRPPLGFREEVIFRNPLVAFLYKNPLMSRSYLAFLTAQKLVAFLVNRQVASSGALSLRMGWTAPYAAGRWKADAQAFKDLVEAARYDWGAAWREEDLSFLESRVLKMRDRCSAKGIKFAVVIFPVAAQLETSAPKDFALLPQNRLAAFFAAKNIPYLDVSAALAGVKAGIFYDNCHYTPAGNAVLSRLIGNFLSVSGILAAGADGR